MKEIGGYFELELSRQEEYHPDAISLNSGRNALEYILRAKKYRKIFLPYYTCGVLLQPLRRSGVVFEFYHINEALEPVFNYASIGEGECFLYTNYFGIKNNFIRSLSILCPHLIIDNSQSFFSMPEKGTDTFYSPRKFVGVPDGAYLYTDILLAEPLEQDTSWNNAAHLLRRIDEGAESGYSLFSENDRLLNDQPIMSMSRLTKRLLGSIDYASILEKRNIHFNFIHDALSEENLLNIDVNGISGPMVYPFKVKDGEKIKQKLIQNKVYVATYWADMLPYLQAVDLESDLIKNLVCIPVDQRLDKDMLKRIIELIHS